MGPSGHFIEEKGHQNAPGKVLERSPKSGSAIWTFIENYKDRETSEYNGQFHRAIAGFYSCYHCCGRLNFVKAFECFYDLM